MNTSLIQKIALGAYVLMVLFFSAMSKAEVPALIESTVEVSPFSR